MADMLYSAVAIIFFVVGALFVRSYDRLYKDETEQGGNR